MLNWFFQFKLNFYWIEWTSQKIQTSFFRFAKIQFKILEFSFKSVLYGKYSIFKSIFISSFTFTNFIFVCTSILTCHYLFVSILCYVFVNHFEFVLTNVCNTNLKWFVFLSVLRYQLSLYCLCLCLLFVVFMFFWCHNFYVLNKFSSVQFNSMLSKYNFINFVI